MKITTFSLPPIFFLTGFFTAAYGAELPITKVELAFLLKYPSERLRVEDIAQQANPNETVDFFSAHKFTGTDDSFAPVVVVVTKQGRMLSTALKEKIDLRIIELEKKMATAALEEAASISRNLENERSLRLTIGTTGFGYAGLGIFGPGGELNRIIVSLPEYGKDIQVTMSIPAEGPFRPLPDTEAYYRIVTGDGKELTELLINCVKTIAANIAQQSKPANGAAPDTKAEPQSVPNQSQGSASRAPSPSAAPASPPALKWLLLAALALGFRFLRRK